MPTKQKAAPIRRTSRSKPIRLKIVIHKAEEGGYWAEVPGFSRMCLRGRDPRRGQGQHQGSIRWRF